MTPERHAALVPMGTQVSSKGRFRFCAGYGPQWILDAVGCRVTDERGRAFIDTTGGLGAMTIGYNRGLPLSPVPAPLPCDDERRLVEFLFMNVKGCDAMRFLKTGTDATSAAIRLARIFTKRDHIVDLGSYHGWADAFITEEHEGVPQCVRDLTIRGGIDDITTKIAAVILEPWPLQGMDLDFLRRVRERCTEVGAVLIYDEVISGFRCGMSGTQDHGAPAPDLVCAGKAMGNGWPISVVYGRPDIMHCWSRTHISGTHFADPAAMTAALHVLDTTRGTMMFDAELPVLPDLFQVVGTKMWWCVKGDPLPLTLLQQKLMDRGYLTNFSHFTYVDFKPHEENYRRALRDCATEVAWMTTEERKLALKGDVNRTVFRRNA